MSQSPPASARFFHKLAIALLLLLPSAVAGFRLGLWDYNIGLMLCALSLVGSFIIQIIHSIWLLRKPPLVTKRLLRKTSLIALPPLLLAISIIRQAADKPVIHDISTDTQSPPQFVSLLNERRPEHNSLAINPETLKLQQQAYPQLKPIISSLPVAEALQKTYLIAEQLGWQLYQLDSEKGRLEATAQSRWFGFIDDIVVRVQTREQGSQIDLRSVSRVGRGDMGVNARRIQRFIDAFDETEKH